jgi:hypothetical protein
MKQLPSLQWLINYPIRTTSIAVALFGLVTSAPKMQSQLAASQQADQIRLQGQSQARLTNASTDAKAKYSEARAKLAESRYQSGVIFVVDPKDLTRLTTISEGQAVAQQGSTTGATLPSGTVVGDINGNTGIISGGVVTDVAYTGNQGIVRAAYDRMTNPQSPTEESQP